MPTIKGPKSQLLTLKAENARLRALLNEAQSLVSDARRLIDAGDFRVQIKTDNAAFDDDPVPEIIKCLRRVIADLTLASTEGFIYDTNGNRVGTFSGAGITA